MNTSYEERVNNAVEQCTNEVVKLRKLIGDVSDSLKHLEPGDPEDFEYFPVCNDVALEFNLCSFDDGSWLKYTAVINEEACVEGRRISLMTGHEEDCSRISYVEEADADADEMDIIEWVECPEPLFTDENMDELVSFLVVYNIHLHR